MVENAAARASQCAAATVRSSQRGLRWERGRPLAWLPSQVISAGGPRMYRACRRGRETSAGGTRMYRACRRGDARTISRTSQQGREWCHQRNLRVPHPRVRSGTHALALATLYGRARGQRTGVRATQARCKTVDISCVVSVGCASHSNSIAQNSAMTWQGTFSQPSPLHAGYRAQSLRR